MKNTMEDNTIDYYESNAEEYFKQTVNANMQTLYEPFERYMKTEGLIIDIGCGSGRDMKYFKEKGYSVEGIEASAALCNLALQNVDSYIYNIKIQDWTPDKKYDGIWACASLLHLEEKEILDFSKVAVAALNNGGVIFFSMKEGIKTGYDDRNRYFTNFTNHLLERFLELNEELVLKEDWYSQDVLHRTDFKWRNIVVVKEGV